MIHEGRGSGARMGGASVQKVPVAQQQQQELQRTRSQSRKRSSFRNKKKSEGNDLRF